LIDIRGEADFSNHTKLQAALSRVTLRGIRVVHVRLTELTFCDLAAFRELLGFTEEARRRCGDITVHDADHTVRRIARVLDVEDQLTLC
jgi:anti-anti-sigma factor